MKFKISKIFKGDRKFFSIVFFILLSVFVVGLIDPFIIENKRSEWDNDLKQKILEIEKSVTEKYKQKENNLLRIKSEVSQKLKLTLSGEKYNYGDLISLLNEKSYEDYSLEVVAPNGKIIAWNKILAMEQDDIFPFVYPLDEVYFLTNGLFTFISAIDTIKIQNDNFYLIVSKPLEKHYKLQNQYYSELSFETELSEKFNTRFEILFDPYNQPSKDGRVYSFNLLNHKGNKIGTVSFSKPLLSVEMAGIKDQFIKIQIILLVTAILFLSLGLRNEFRKINLFSVKLIVIIIYSLIVRIVLFWIGFPAKFLEGALVDPSYFSSTFAGGLVKTPIEALVTNIFLLIIGIAIFKYTLFNYAGMTDKRFRFFKILITPLLAVSLFYTLRAMSASIKSIVFDSTIRYFKEPDLIPNLPSLMMNLNVVLIGFSCISIMIVITYLIGRYLGFLGGKPKFGRYFSYFLILQIACLVFFAFQREPLITPFMCFIFFTLVFIVLYYHLIKNPKIVVSMIYTSVIAAVITVSMLSYFNLELERRSLKTIAYEVNRSNKDLLNFLVNETLRNSITNDRLVNSFYKLNSNYDAEAFMLWSKSALQRESLNSMVVLLDRNYKTLGEFSVGYNFKFDFREKFGSRLINEQVVQEFPDPQSQGGSSFAGIVPISKNNLVTGYVAVAAKFNIENLGTADYPLFLESNKIALGSVVDLSLIKVFEFIDGSLRGVYGNIFPSKEQKEQIFSAPLSELNEAWISLSIYGENYLAYLLKAAEDGSEKFIVVAVKEKEIAWSLYNFFKIFIVHSLFILISAFVLILFGFIKIEYKFRTKLLIAFLLISIIPMIALAVYNREVVRERSANAIFNELSKRSDYLENHIRAQTLKHPDRNLSVAFENAGRELGIDFSVYSNSNQIFTSQSQFYKSNLIESKLNPEAHYNLSYLSYRDFLLNEKIENYSYHAYYRKTEFNYMPVILGVNDALNKIELSYSPLEADVFLFGVYSFALIVIIFISTLFANQISSPIRQLTKATQTVAQGDLSINLENKERGELKELFDGFNLMTSELQKNQLEIAGLERENAWKEMAKQVAHEIKNPLTPMKLSVQQLIAAYNDKKSDFSEILKKLSQAVLNQIENLNQIATEFSSLAKMPSLYLEELDFIPVIIDTVNLFSDEKAHVTFNTHAKSLIIEGDQSQIRRMIINLIRNSIQAEASKVELTASSVNGMAVLEISDNGNGIPSELQSRIFETNFTTKEKGLGLGLKLIRRFLESIKGEIILMESSAWGTTFRIQIPLKG